MKNNTELKEYNDKGYVIHYKDSIDYEWWKEYNNKGNEIHYKDSYGNEWWKKI